MHLPDFISDKCSDYPYFKECSECPVHEELLIYFSGLNVYVDDHSWKNNGFNGDNAQLLLCFKSDDKDIMSVTFEMSNGELIILPFEKCTHYTCDKKVEELFYNNIINDKEVRDKFVNAALKYIKKNGFTDGDKLIREVPEVDDWEIDLVDYSTADPFVPIANFEEHKKEFKAEIKKIQKKAKKDNPNKILSFTGDELKYLVNKHFAELSDNRYERKWFIGTIYDTNECEIGFQADYLRSPKKNRDLTEILYIRGVILKEG